MSKINNCLTGLDNSCIPVWFMRQAGRYLPEFRDLRQRNQDFLKLCLNSDLATEITLQPLNRFNLDAAIIFSDILIVPYAMNQQIEFGRYGGPIVKEFNINSFLKVNKKEFYKKLEQVYLAIKKTRKKLDKHKSLIAFVGAPWTLLIYLFNLKKDGQLNEKLLEGKEDEIKKIFFKLDEFLKHHIIAQKDAGADIIQIFDSWAGLIEKKKLENYCYNPNKSLVEFCKKKGIPVICFPKGLKENYKSFVDIVKPNCISIDHEIDPEWAKKNLKNICIQGGMDPHLLLKDEKEALGEVDRYLNIFKNNSYIFNLGHGILPQTNPDLIERIVSKIRENK